MLENSGYMGITYYGQTRVEKVKNQARPLTTRLERDEWIPIEGFTPPIVSKETFELAQRRLQAPKLRPGRALYPYLLTGHIFCGYCNTPLTGSTLGRRYRYYRCRGTWPTSVGPATCHARYIRADALEEAVWEACRKAILHPEIWLADMRRARAEQEGPLDDEIARIKREVKRCKDQELRLVKLYQFAEVDDDWIRGQSGPLKLMREGYERELQRLEEQKLALMDMERIEAEVLALCARLEADADDADFAEKQRALVLPQSNVVGGYGVE